MLYRISADAVVVIHVCFVAFAILGGLLVLRWRWVIWAHLPAVAWAVIVEVMSWPCPLTPLENWFRRYGGEAGYEGGFVQHYIMPVVYPDGLTEAMQMAIGVFVFAFNLVVYGLLIYRQRSRASLAAQAAASAPNSASNSAVAGVR